MTKKSSSSHHQNQCQHTPHGKPSVSEMKCHKRLTNSNFKLLTTLTEILNSVDIFIHLDLPQDTTALLPHGVSQVSLSVSEVTSCFICWDWRRLSLVKHAGTCRSPHHQIPPADISNDESCQYYPPGDGHLFSI